jgi:hypothetical protein
VVEGCLVLDFVSVVGCLMLCLNVFMDHRTIPFRQYQQHDEYQLLRQ